MTSRFESRARRILRKAVRTMTGHDRKVARIEPEGPARGTVLVSYILDPLLAGTTEDHSHTHFWETLTIARTFAELGYAVDGISWTNHSFVPSQPYDFFIDVRLNLERLAPMLEGTTRIFHSDACHWRFNNQAQANRHDALEQRRGVRLEAHKLMPENRGIEEAHLLTYLGNEFTRKTFDFANKPSFRVPVSVPFLYDWPEDKEWNAVRRSFLWFGSGGLVHKGLDLVLEAFAGLPDHRLTVCGPIEAEADFAREYRGELYDSPNIETLGWIDSGSREFERLCRSTLALVYPSCAEGGGSSALTCMHAGLIPMLTESASVDLTPETGIELVDLSIEGLRERIVDLSERPASELEGMARNAWQWVRGHHSREIFARCYRDFAQKLVEGQLVEGRPFERPWTEDAPP